MNNDEVMFEDWEYEYMNEIVKRDTEENIRNDVKEEFQEKLKKAKKEFKDKELQYKNNEKKFKDNEKRFKDNEKASILNMFKEGFDSNLISRITGKSVKEIEKIIL